MYVYHAVKEGGTVEICVILAALRILFLGILSRNNVPLGRLKLCGLLLLKKENKKSTTT